MLPIDISSITKFSLFTNLLNREVFVLIFSTKASWGPFITISLLGLSILLSLNPLTSISKAISKVSINKAQFPELILAKISSNYETSLISFWGTRHDEI